MHSSVHLSIDTPISIYRYTYIHTCLSVYANEYKFTEFKESEFGDFYLLHYPEQRQEHTQWYSSWCLSECKNKSSDRESLHKVAIYSEIEWVNKPFIHNTH